MNENEKMKDSASNPKQGHRETSTFQVGRWSWGPQREHARTKASRTLPFLSYWEPWHGHMNLLAALFQGTTQPKWVHTAFTPATTNEA